MLVLLFSTCKWLRNTFLSLNKKGRRAKTSHSYKEISIEERKYIIARRNFLATKELIPSTSDDDTQRNSSDNKEASISDDTVGLALSGGGIRSATFGLGILQGLAQVGLLPRIDYLSTVSGGGYIGSWLSAWCKEEGFEKVSEGLLPTRYRINDAHNEPAQIKHLRLYSNYLAPIPGIFSMDGWCLLAIYLRNFVLNFSVFILALLGLFCGLRFIIELYSIFGNAEVSLSDWWYGGLTCVLLSAGILIYAVLYTLSLRLDLYLSSHAPKGECALSPLFPGKFAIISLALLCSLLFASPFCISAIKPKGYMALFLIPWLFWSALFNGIIGYAVMRKKHAGFVVGSLAGVIGGSVAFFIIKLLFKVFPDIHVALSASLYVPILLGCFVISNYFHVGFMSDSLNEDEREWWSRINAETLYIGAIWLMLFGITIFGPWLVRNAVENSWSTYLVSISWLGTTMAGIITAKGKSTQDDNVQGLKSFLAQIAPYMFLVGMLTIVATGAIWIMYDIQDSSVIARRPDLPTKSFFSVTPFSILEGLNDQKIDLSKKYHITVLIALAAGGVIFNVLSFVLASRIGLNRFTLHNMYANRLIRCYLGARKKRNFNLISNIAPNDDLQLSSLNIPCDSPVNCALQSGPFHIINAAINCKTGDMIHNSEPPSLGLKDRLADSFIFTPLYTGCEKTGYCKTEEFYGNLKLGTAMSVSGAALSPNMGFHTSPAVTALLTLFNLRLGAWFGNPADKKTAYTVNPSRWLYMFRELLGYTDYSSDYIYVSDGGHFENMGVYELLRRKCRFIIACDAGADNNSLCENLGDLIRKARIDYGLNIDIDIRETMRKPDGMTGSHVAVGRIKYGDNRLPTENETAPLLNDPCFHYRDNEGIIVYIKTALTGDEPVDLLNYRAENPSFPDETTIDQFFNESQFESYRELGLHSIVKLFSEVKFRTENNQFTALASEGPGAENAATTQDFGDRPSTEYWEINNPQINLKLAKTSTHSIFEDLYYHWLANPLKDHDDSEIQKTYQSIVDDLSQTTNLHNLAREILGTDIKVDSSETAVNRNAEMTMIVRMANLLQIIWVQRKIQAHGMHPSNRGWNYVMTKWCNSFTFRRYWRECCKQFDPTFCKYVNYLNSQSGK